MFKTKTKTKTITIKEWSLFVDSEYDRNLKEPFLSLQLVIKENDNIISKIFIITEEKYLDIQKKVLDKKRKEEEKEKDEVKEKEKEKEIELKKDVKLKEVE